MDCLPPFRFGLTAVDKLRLQPCHHASLPDLDPQCRPCPETAKTSPSEGCRVTGSTSHTEYGGSPYQIRTVYKNCYQHGRGLKTKSTKISRRLLAKAVKQHSRVALQIKSEGLNEILWMTHHLLQPPPSHTLSQQLSSRLTTQLARAHGYHRITTSIQGKILSRMIKRDVNMCIQEITAEMIDAGRSPHFHITVMAQCVAGILGATAAWQDSWWTTLSSISSQHAIRCVMLSKRHPVQKCAQVSVPVSHQRCVLQANKRVMHFPLWPFLQLTHSFHTLSKWGTRRSKG